jgi:alanine racemase
MQGRRRDALDHDLATHPAWKEVDLAALESNYREVRRRVGPEVKIIASVKANAYGHGVVEVARALDRLGVYALATGSFADAVAVREAGLSTRIQMFAGNAPEGAKELLRHDLMPTVYDMAGAKAVSEAAARTVPVYVKVDAGLGRLGVPLERAEAFVKEVARLPRIEVEGVYTHLSFGDAAGKAWASERLVGFHRLVEALARAGFGIPVTQALASAGVACAVSDTCSAVCVGHLLYGGLSLLPPEVADLSAFRPVLKSVKTRLVHVGRRRAGEGFLTGGKLIAQSDLMTGVVPIGMFDGYRRPAKGEKPAMLMRGRRVPVLGVSLEYTTLDLTGVDGPERGEEVTALGEGIGIDEVAGWQGSSVLEVLMGFDRRLPCRYLGAEEAVSGRARKAG